MCCCFFFTAERFVWSLKRNPPHRSPTSLFSPAKMKMTQRLQCFCCKSHTRIGCQQSHELPCQKDRAEVMKWILEGKTFALVVLVGCDPLKMRHAPFFWKNPKDLREGLVCVPHWSRRGCWAMVFGLRERLWKHQIFGACLQDAGEESHCGGDQWWTTKRMTSRTGQEAGESGSRKTRRFLLIWCRSWWEKERKKKEEKTRQKHCTSFLSLFLLRLTTVHSTPQHREGKHWQKLSKKTRKKKQEKKEKEQERKEEKKVCQVLFCVFLFVSHKLLCVSVCEWHKSVCGWECWTALVGNYQWHKLKLERYRED